MITIPENYSGDISIVLDCTQLKTQGKNYQIGHFLFKGDGNFCFSNLKLVHESNSLNNLVKKSKHFIDLREICMTLTDPEPGNYIYIPATFDPGRFGRYKVFVYSTQTVQIEPILDIPEKRIRGDWNPSGGAVNFGQFYKNPQYQIQV